MTPLDDKDLTDQLPSGVADCQAGVSAAMATVLAAWGSGPVTALVAQAQVRAARRSGRRP